MNISTINRDLEPKVPGSLNDKHSVEAHIFHDCKLLLTKLINEVNALDAGIRTNSAGAENTELRASKSQNTADGRREGAIERIEKEIYSSSGQQIGLLWLDLPSGAEHRSDRGMVDAYAHFLGLLMERTFLSAAFLPNTIRDLTKQIWRSQAIMDRAEYLAKLGYFVFDTGSLSTSYVSPGLHNLATSMDPSVQEHTLESLLSRVHESDRSKVENTVMLAVSNGESLDLRFRANTSDGLIEHLHLMDTSIKGEDGEDFRVALIQDVTEQTEREQALQENIALREAVTDCALDCIISMDQKGLVTEFNPAAEKTFGYDKTEVIGRPLAEFIIPEHLREAHIIGLERYLASGEHAVLGKRIEIDALSAEGRIFPIELAITPFSMNGNQYFTAYLRDISEQKKAADDLSRSEENLALAQKIAHLGSWEWDLKSGSIVCNEEVNVIFDLMPGARVSARLYITRIHQSDRDRVLHAIRRAQCGGTQFNIEHRIVRPNGEIRFVSMRGIPRTQETGQVVSYFGTVVDTTEVQRAKENLRTAKEQAEAGSRAKTQFLAVMSHEIRTPLNGVIGGLNLLRDTVLDPEQESHLELAINSSEGLLALINDILDYSKIEAGKLEIEEVPTNLHELIYRIAEIVGPMAKRKNLPVFVHLTSDVPAVVKIDPGSLRQILLNLLSNAVKFTEAGRVTLDVSINTTNVQVKDDRLPVRFSVEDTGIGIKRDELDNLFEEFHQVDGSYQRRFGGSGLGLAIAKRLVEAFGGQIGCTSEEGVGSRFWFEVPLQTADIDAIPSAEEKQYREYELAGRILLAEDSATNAYVAKAYLRSERLRVDHVGNGREAVNAVRERPYDLILMDLSMPEMDGLEATRRIRSMDGAVSKIPIVAMTANASSIDRTKCYDAGMNDVITKPVARNVLRSSVGSWLERHLAGRMHENGRRQKNDPVCDLPLFDEDTLSNNFESIEPSLAAEVFSIFAQEMGRRIKELERHQHEGDLRSIARQAHSTRSAAGNIGAMALTDIARRTEMAAQSNSHDLNELIAQLVKISEATIDHISVLEKAYTQQNSGENADG